LHIDRSPDSGLSYCTPRPARIRGETAAQRAIGGTSPAGTTVASAQRAPMSPRRPVGPPADPMHRTSSQGESLMQWENRSAFVYVKTYPGKAQEVYQQFQKNPQVLACFMMPGVHDLMVWFDSKNMTDVYNWIAAARDNGQIEQTATYPAYYGYWNGESYQNKKYYGWIKVRSDAFNAAYDYACQYDGVTFCASVTGDYDCFVMVCSDSYDKFHDYQQQFKNRGYQVEFYVPFQAYWNPKADAYWQQYEKDACVTTR
jgi:DNA-binding Lrp family transcriptional regulator